MAGESFEIRGAFLQSPEEGEAVRIRVRVIILINVHRLLIGGLGQIGRQVMASRNVLVCSDQDVRTADGLMAREACLRCLKRGADLGALVADSVRERSRFECVFR